jgi:hypothetical protein
LTSDFTVTLILVVSSAVSMLSATAMTLIPLKRRRLIIASVSPIARESLESLSTTMASNGFDSTTASSALWSPTTTSN